MHSSSQTRCPFVPTLSTQIYVLKANLVMGSSVLQSLTICMYVSNRVLCHTLGDPFSVEIPINWGENFIDDDHGRIQTHVHVFVCMYLSLYIYIYCGTTDVQ